MTTPDSTTKQCTKCKQTFPATSEFFHKNGNSLRPDCCVCFRKQRQQYYAANREKVREKNKHNYQKHKEERQSKGRQYHALNRARDNERMRQRYATHREEYRTRTHEYYESHREQIAAYARQWRAANATYRLEKKRQWRRNNPEQARLAGRRYRHRRRTQINQVEVVVAVFDEATQLKRQRGKCYYCGCKLEKYHVDHVVPLSRGGSDHPDNKVLACPTCNLRKHSKLPHEWAEGGRLL